SACAPRTAPTRASASPPPGCSRCGPSTPTGAPGWWRRRRACRHSNWPTVCTRAANSNRPRRTGGGPGRSSSLRLRLDRYLDPARHAARPREVTQDRAYEQRQYVGRCRVEPVADRRALVDAARRPRGQVVDFDAQLVFVPDAGLFDRVVAGPPPRPRPAEGDAAVRAPGTQPDIGVDHRVRIDETAELARNAIVEADREARVRRLL